MGRHDEDSAAMACLAALTLWFEQGEAPVGEVLGPEDPVHVVEFLFGQLVATVTDLCEALDADPSEYLQALALQIAQESADV